MKVIASRENPAYRRLQRLLDSPRARKDEGKTVLEGVHLAESWIERGLPLEAIWVCEGQADEREVLAITTRLGHIPQTVLTERLFAGLTDAGAGIKVLGIVPIPPPSSGARLSDGSVLLDRVQDPGNVGAILRSAAAAGLNRALLSTGCASAWSPRVLRAAMGAHACLDIHEDVPLGALLEEPALSVYATSSHAADSIYGLDLVGPCAWLFGNEGQGVSADLAAKAHAVSIPQEPRVESLNVAAAAAVCFFEQRRQRLRG